MKLEFVAAAFFVLFGLVSAVRSLREPTVDESGRARLLIVVHDAAKALFWLALGSFFLAYGLAEEPQNVRWLALIPVGMAALRLVTATFLGASERDRN